MQSDFETDSKLPMRAGVGLKASHYHDILTTLPDIGWFEIHAENYMGDGGPPHEALRKIRQHYPLSCHGVGLSIGSAGDLDPAHLARLDKVCNQYKPGLFSEHLAWSTHDNSFLNDLLPVPYNEETLARVVAHIDLVQHRLGRQMLLENPSIYVAFEQSNMSEIDFLREVVKRTGCGLLLDVNNVYVSAINQGYSPEQYLNEFPVEAVGEIHLGGHAEDLDENGDLLLIDAHDREVVEHVWQLYADLMVRIGPRPTLIEWDNNVPDWATLFAEASRADDILLSVANSREASNAA